eukprot:959763-Prorocentrum_minimum.AAC.1
MRGSWGLRATRSGKSGARRSSACTTSPPLRTTHTAMRAGCHGRTGWATARATPHATSSCCSRRPEIMRGSW